MCKDICDWMLCNKLKLNQDKTELLVISSKYRPRPPLDYIRVGEEVIKSSKQARNLGVGFDQYLDFKEHVKITCKGTFFRIPPYVWRQTKEKGHFRQHRY